MICSQWFMAFIHSLLILMAKISSSIPMVLILVAQNVWRTSEGNQVFYEINFKFTSALILNKCLNQFKLPVFCPLIKTSLGNPHLKILDL